MVRNVLVDTGVLLACLDRKDSRHQSCVNVLAELRSPAITTLAVLTEFFHLARKRLRAERGAWALLNSGHVTLAPIHLNDLPDIELLMTRYADRPMDFADATLVHVAGRENIAAILTIDHDDFETYRFGRNRKFRILPGR